MKTLALLLVLAGCASAQPPRYNYSSVVQAELLEKSRECARPVWSVRHGAVCRGDGS